MNCVMSYGTRGIAVSLPYAWDVTILAKKRMPVPGDPHAVIRGALDSPIGSGRLNEEARGCASACILVCDVTRPVPNGLVLRPVIEALLAAGLEAKAITVLVATGLHRPNEGGELAAVIGDAWVLERVTIANHFARRDDDHRLVGTTRQGVPVRIDRRFLETDLRIAVGLVEPHFMAGWSGGRKLILPGIAHADTIAAFHAWGMLGHPRAATCLLEGNPLHEAQQETLGMVGRTLGVNLVIDHERALSFASFGGIEESHTAAVRFADPYFRLPVPRRFPVVLASGAGFPLDATYYQTVKGICCGASILAPRGDLFVVSACSEGFGSTDFRAAQERLCRDGREKFRAEAASRPRAHVDEWETMMLLKALDSGTVHLFSGGLTEEEHALTGAVRIIDLPRELRAAVESSLGRKIAVLPEGPYVAPEVSSDAEGGSS